MKELATCDTLPVALRAEHRAPFRHRLVYSNPLSFATFQTSHDTHRIVVLADIATTLATYFGATNRAEPGLTEHVRVTRVFDQTVGIIFLVSDD